MKWWRTKKAGPVQLKIQAKAAAQRLGIAPREVVRETRRAMIRLIAEELARVEVKRRREGEPKPADAPTAGPQETPYERFVREQGSDFPQDRR